MNMQLSYPFMFRGVISDFDYNGASGLYYYAGDVNINQPVKRRSIMLMANIPLGRSFQLVVTEDNDVYVRFYSGSWNDWIKK